MKRIVSKPLDMDWECQFQSFLNSCDREEISFSKQLPLARKFVWEQENGYQLPTGYWIRHNCQTRACVNPAHAVLVKANHI